MNLKQVFLSLILSFLTFSNLKAQESIDPAYLKEHLPASPEASDLGRYGEIATNPYNGKVNLSVPIHEINLDGLSIPIQLSYDSGGIRAQAESSWVGMNWTLSGNAAITRSIYGNDDLNEGIIPGAEGDISAFPFNKDTEVTLIGGFQGVSEEDIIEMHMSNGIGPHIDDPENHGDMQPDIFEVSLFGKNYKFQFNKRAGLSNELTTHIFNNNNASITYNLSLIHI